MARENFMANGGRGVARHRAIPSAGLARRVRTMGNRVHQTLPKKAPKPPISAVCASPHFCSMKITEGLRRYAADLQISEAEELKKGMKEKSVEFAEAGAELYQKA